LIVQITKRSIFGIVLNVVEWLARCADLSDTATNANVVATTAGSGFVKIVKAVEILWIYEKIGTDMLQH
jgi:hypothetical protein